VRSKSSVHQRKRTIRARTAARWQEVEHTARPPLRDCPSQEWSGSRWARGRSSNSDSAGTQLARRRERRRRKEKEKEKKEEKKKKSQPHLHHAARKSSAVIRAADAIFAHLAATVAALCIADRGGNGGGGTRRRAQLEPVKVEARSVDEKLEHVDASSHIKLIGQCRGGVSAIGASLRQSRGCTRNHVVVKQHVHAATTCSRGGPRCDLIVAGDRDGDRVLHPLASLDPAHIVATFRAGLNVHCLRRPEGAAQVLGRCVVVATLVKVLCLDLGGCEERTPRGDGQTPWGRASGRPRHRARGRLKRESERT
jgi:hypothetical protein